MRVIAGKVLMDRNAPADLVDDVATGEREMEELIARWHGRARLAYAVTVRFAPTSSREQLALAGRLCRADPTLYLQTHVAENRAEVRWVHELFPEARSYLDVYAAVGLLHARSVFAHGIWLDDADRAAIAAAGAQIAHSPSSNLFLGSGLFGWRAAEAAGHPRQPGERRRRRHEPVDAAQHGRRLQDPGARRRAADGVDRRCTRRRAARRWRSVSTDEIGSLDVGAAADVCVWDAAVGTVATRRAAVARTLHERVFAWMTLADERNLVQAFVAGRPHYDRDGA